MSSIAQLRWEYEAISGEQAAHDFAAMFEPEIQELAEWINRAPESVDVEAIFESICEDHDFDHTDDGYGTNWDWVRDTFEDYSPRLKAARLARGGA